MAQILFLLCCFLVGLLPGIVYAQPSQQAADVTLDGAARAAVIDGALKALNESYVFPAVAKQMEESIRARQTRGEYDSITNGREFAQVLTDHLRAVSRDKHLSVNYTSAVMPPEPPSNPPAVRPSPDDQSRLERQNALAARQNYGFTRIERLAGNIGYLDLRSFMPPEVAAETTAAAMTFLAGCEAVIFDMRQNFGGHPAGVAYLTSYLFGSQPIHLNDFYFRPTNRTSASWTLAYVPGRRLTNKDVYVLTSQRTFSGAEEFTYNLKHLKRATIVGEITAGGAHLVGGKRINDHFMIGVPTGRPINAVTKSNWEGTGVEPDVKVPADRALHTAHLLALEKLDQTIPSDAMGLKTEVLATIQTLRKELGPPAESATAAGPAAAPRAGDDFESGTLANWRSDQSGAGGWFVYSNGKAAPEPAFSDPNVPFDVPDPPQGKFAAVTDMNGPGRRIIYRDITLDDRYMLRLTVFYVNEGGAFTDLDALNHSTIGDHQQYRIDLIAPSAPVASLAKNDVLAKIFQTRPGDPSRRAPVEIKFDLSPWRGKTVRLRLASADSQGPLRAGVDAITLERLGK